MPNTPTQKAARDKKRAKRKAQRESEQAEKVAEAQRQRLHEGLEKCLETGHVSMGKFEVKGVPGIKFMHACKQCGLMYWE